MMQFSAKEIGVGKSEVTVGKKIMTFNAHPHALFWALRQYSNGASMQDAFHFLTVEEREFLISGFTPEDWNNLIGEE